LYPNETLHLHRVVAGLFVILLYRAHVEYNARQISRVTYWVRNVSYEMVVAVAEGEHKKVERFIEIMRDGLHGAQVNESKVAWEEPTGEFDGFGVRRSM
jgi:acylphosphatase